jgi:hypothetical protein
MTYLENLQQELFYLIAPSGFAHKYYSFYEAHPEVEKELEVDQELLEKALLASGLDFRFIRASGFFESLEKYDDLEIGLSVAIHNSKLEFMLVLKTAERRIEWPFWGLAAEIELLRDADFEYFPRNPKLPVSSLDSLEETVNFGVTLYKQVKNLILSHRTAVVNEGFWNEVAA